MIPTITICFRLRSLDLRSLSCRECFVGGRRDNSGIAGREKNDLKLRPTVPSVIAPYKILKNLHRRPIMTTQEVADKLVRLCSEGKFREATEKLYSPDIVSMEAGAPPGQSRESKGLSA